MRFFGFLAKILFPFVKFYWFIFRPKTYGVKCIVYNGNKILLIKNTYGSRKWTFSGGGIKRGETEESAALREVIEELSVSVKNICKIGQFESIKEYKKDNIAVFAGESSNKEFKIDPREILEAKWFYLNDLPEMSEIAKKVLAIWEY